MVELALHRLPDERDVVRLVRAAQKGTNHQLLVRSRHHLLGNAKAQHLAKQLDGAVEVVAVEKTVVETRRRDPAQVVGPGIWVEILSTHSATVAHFLFLREQLHHVSRGYGEAEALAGFWMLAGGNPLEVGAQARLLYIGGKFF